MITTDSWKADTAGYTMRDDNFLYCELTEKIISCFYHVYNTLGYGFLEKVYENAMIIELEKNGFSVDSQKSINVIFEDKIVGEYYADIVVDNRVILELKACEALNHNHEFQLLNYLKATNIEVGLLFNFGFKPQFVRKVFSNTRKTDQLKS